MEQAARRVPVSGVLPPTIAAAIAGAALWLAAGEALVGAVPGTAGAQSIAVAAKPPNVGVNLEGLADWARMKPFADLMKTARPWGTPDEPWRPDVPVDAEGWPMADAGVVVAVHSRDEGDPVAAYRYMAAGTYALSFTGRAAVSTTASNGVSVRNYRYDAAANRSTADVEIGDGTTQLMLVFRETQGGVRNVSLLLPGYAGTGKTFTDEFMAAIRPFGTLRFMDWLATNNNPVRSWQERTLPSSATQASERGVAFEYVVQLANEADKDIWINIPLHADDDYVRQLARLLKQRLEPGRAVYVEYSNEVWNTIFSQTGDNADAAVAEALAGDRSLTNGSICTAAAFERSAGGCNRWWAGYFRVGKKIAAISRIFAEVSGADAINGRVRPVYASQFADRNMAEQVLKNIATYRGQPRALIYGIATAPYYRLDPELSNSKSLSEDAVFASFEESLRSEILPFFASGVGEKGRFSAGRAYAGGDWTSPSQKALASHYGLRSLTYEGGADYPQGEAGLAIKFRTSESPRAAEQLLRYVGRWHGCGNDLYMHFTLTSPSGRYGYWGLTNDPRNLRAAKYQALARYAASGVPSATCG